MSLINEARKTEDLKRYSESKSCYHTYTTNRHANLAEFKRCYLWLKGDMKGYTKAENNIKEKYPNCKKVTGDNQNMIVWDLPEEAIWDFFMTDSYYKMVLEKRRINNYQELRNAVTY